MSFPGFSGQNTDTQLRGICFSVVQWIFCQPHRVSVCVSEWKGGKSSLCVFVSVNTDCGLPKSTKVKGVCGPRDIVNVGWIRLLYTHYV